MTEIICVICGAVIAFFTEWFFHRREKKMSLTHSASILLNDLNSIRRYVEDELRLNSKPLVNIRYSVEWQSTVADCTFLKGRFIYILYKIYDNVYDYNYCFEHEFETTYRKSISKDYLVELFQKNPIVKELFELLERLAS